MTKQGALDLPQRGSIALAARAVIPPVADGIEIRVASLRADGDAIRAAAALLSPSERERVSRFAFDRDRRRFIVGRAWLRRLLAERLDAPPESIALTCGAHGKPALAPRSAGSDVRFNVSHCDDLAAYAFSTGREIGIDVEAVRVLPDADALAARFFSSREYEAYRSLAPRDRPPGFFACWTRKEAFIKALGAGLSHPLDAFDVSLVPDLPAKILRVANTDGDCCGWSLECFVPAPGFVGAVVTETRRSHGGASPSMEVDA